MKHNACDGYFQKLQQTFGKEKIQQTPGYLLKFETARQDNAIFQHQ